MLGYSVRVRAGHTGQLGFTVLYAEAEYFSSPLSRRKSTLKIRFFQGKIQLEDRLFFAQNIYPRVDFF